MLRNNKNYLYFLSAQGVSQIGDWVYWVTILSLVYATTKSGLALASVPIVLTGTRFLVGTFAGVVADKFDRKKLMILANMGQGILVALLLLSLQLQGTAMLAFILLMTFLISLLSTLYEPTKKSVIPMIVDKPEILKANTTMESLMNIIWIMGPLLGGGLITFLGYEAGFLFNSATFFLSALLILPLRLPDRIPATTSFIQDFKEGFGYLRRKKLILFLTLSTFVMMLGAGGVNALMAAVPQDLYKVDPKIGYSIFLSMIGIGWVLGNLVLVKASERLSSQKDKLRVWFFSRILSGATIIGVVYAGGFRLAAAIWLVHGVFNSLHDSIETTMIQESADEKMTGRIFGIKGTLEESAAIASMVICGLLYEYYDVIASFTYSGILELASAFMIVVFLFFWTKNKEQP